MSFLNIADNHLNTIFPWFSQTWQQLAAYKERQKLPNAILLQGLAGIGKMTFANQYAQFILCTQAKDRACQHCKGCLLFQAGNHPDFIFIRAESGTSIKIEQIRKLVQTLAQTSALGGHQVVLISKAEDMNRSAANALLKTLEEPAGKVIFLLLSDEPTRVLPTIRSRCQIIKFSVPPKMQAVEWLTQQLGTDKNVIAYLSMADYMPLKALHYGQPEHFKLRDDLLESLKQINLAVVDPIKVAATYLTQAKNVLDILMFLIMDMIRIKLSSAQLINYHDKISELTQVSDTRSLQQLFCFLDDLLAAVRSFLTPNNVNLQLLIEKIFINWYYKYDIN